MKCPHCSNEISDTARFCDNCGTKMCEAAIDIPPNDEPDEPKKVKFMIHVIPPDTTRGVLLILLALFGTIPITAGAICMVIVVSSLIYYPLVIIFVPVAIVLGIMLFVKTIVNAIHAFSGERRSICPYCKEFVFFSNSVSLVGCKHCKKQVPYRATIYMNLSDSLQKLVRGRPQCYG